MPTWCRGQPVDAVTDSERCARAVCRDIVTECFDYTDGFVTKANRLRRGREIA